MPGKIVWQHREQCLKTKRLACYNICRKCAASEESVKLNLVRSAESSDPPGETFWEGRLTSQLGLKRVPWVLIDPSI